MRLRGLFMWEVPVDDTFCPKTEVLFPDNDLSPDDGSFHQDDGLLFHLQYGFSSFFKMLYSLPARQWRGKCALQRHVGRMRCATRNISLRVEQGRCFRSASDEDWVRRCLGFVAEVWGVFLSGHFCSGKCEHHQQKRLYGAVTECGFHSILLFFPDEFVVY